MTKYHALIAAPLLAFSTPAYAEPLPKLEYAWQALNIIDTAQTAHCLDKGTCEEANPLIGKHPSTGKLIAYKAGMGAMHFGVTRLLQEIAPEWVRPWEIVSVAVQGGVVVANMRFVF